MFFGLFTQAPTLVENAGETVLQWNLYSFVCQTFGIAENTTLGSVLMIASVLLCIISPSLIGSFNPAITFSRIIYKEDIRSHGSGNAGATNILRTYGPKMAALIFVIDFLKAALAVVVGSLIFMHSIGGAIAALFVVMGHLFPVFYKFKGGKGVACTAACILCLSPYAFLILLPLFIVLVAMTRYISLGSISCAFLFPILTKAFGAHGLISAAAAVIAVLVIFMHRENIKRLLNRTESKVSFKKKASEAQAENTEADKKED